MAHLVKVLLIHLPYYKPITNQDRLLIKTNDRNTSPDHCMAAENGAQDTSYGS